MRGWLGGLLAGLLAAVLLIAAAAGAAWWWLHRAPAVEPGTTLVLRLHGGIAEREPADLSLLGEPRPWTLWRLVECLRAAAADPRIAALVFIPEQPDAGWAKLAEIHSALAAFGKSGKPVIAALRTPGARDYYLATAAGRIAAPPGDYINLKGLRAGLLYLRGTLDKLGIVPEFEAIGKYKDGADILTRTGMSAETREVMNGLLDERYAALVAAIATARQKTPDQVKALLDQGPFTARQAHQAGLIDSLLFDADLHEELRAKFGHRRFRQVDAAAYQRAVPRAPSGAARIALLTAEGEIARSPHYPSQDPLLSPDGFSAAIEAIEQDDAIRAVILRIDSPGGDAIASDEILARLRRLGEKKPLVVSMSDLAASGGYAIALAAPHLVAYPETLTGSIGIFFGKLNLQGLYAKLGVNQELLTRGRFAAMDSEASALDPAARAKLRGLLEEMYRDFVRQVAQARQRSFEQMDQVAQGRLWLGTGAKQAGLVDELGGFSVALAAARRRAGLAPDHPLRVEVFPKAPDLVASLRERIAGFGMVRAAVPEARLWKRAPRWSPVR